METKKRLCLQAPQGPERAVFPSARAGHTLRAEGVAPRQWTGNVSQQTCSAQLRIGPPMLLELREDSEKQGNIFSPMTLLSSALQRPGLGCAVPQSKPWALLTLLSAAWSWVCPHCWR